MQKDIFTDEQEDQIRRAFGRLDGELGLQGLDDARDLERIFSNVQDTSLSQSWLSKRLHEVEEKLTKLAHAIEVLLDQNRAFEFTEKNSSSLTGSYLVHEYQASPAVTSMSNDLRIIGDKLIESTLALEKKQEELHRVHELAIRKLSHEFEERLHRLMLALEKQEELLHAAEFASRENSDAEFVLPSARSA